MHTFFLQSRDGRFCGKVCNVSIIKMIDKKKEGRKEGVWEHDEAFGVLDETGVGRKRGRSWIDAKAWKPNLKKEEAKGDRVNRCLIVICQSL